MNRIKLQLSVIAFGILIGTTFVSAAGEEFSEALIPKKHDPRGDRGGTSSGRDDPSKRWQKDKIEININEDIVNEVEEKRIKYKKVVNQIYDFDLLMTPIIKPFRAINNEIVTTEFITTFQLPDQYRIISATPSETMSMLTFSENILTIKPRRTFIQGNISLTITNGTENKTMQVVLKKYYAKYAKNRGYSSKYARNDAFVSTIVVYQEPAAGTDIDILEAYYKLFGETCRTTFEKDGDFDVFTYEEIPYYVIRDDKFGRIEFEGINFNISHEYREFAEQAKYNFKGTR